MKKVIVIGGGAAGLMAAISAARAGAKVTILEHMEKPGKKLLVTGNGRCNLTNLSMKDENLFRSNHPELVKRSLSLFMPEDTLKFFKSLGVLTYDREGYVYPLTNQAVTVADGLIRQACHLGVTIKSREHVLDIHRSDEGWKVATQTWSYPCDCVILAAGSQAAPATGSDGSGYTLAKSLDLTMVPVIPGLVPLKIRENFSRKISGLRMKAELTLFLDGVETARERGELQWTDYGISGIVTFQLSRYGLRALEEGQQVSMVADCLPDYGVSELMEYLNELYAQGKHTPTELLSGIYPVKFLNLLLELSKQKGNQKLKNISQLLPLIEKSKHMTMTITGSKGMEAAQICGGGVAMTEINPDTMEVIKAPGLYLAGELLDVDGACGGYNLQWAWTSGYLAGTHAGKETHDTNFSD